MDDISTNLQVLKGHIISIAGMSMTNVEDCSSLKNLIEKKTGQHISEIVLRRLFTFTPSRFHPSHYTRDLLAKYCDYNNWDDFKERTLPLN